SNSSFSGSITGANSNDNSCFAGIIGRINHASNAATDWKLTTVALSGTVENTAARTNQRIGGLVACISAYSCNDDKYKSRKLTLDGVTADGLTVSGTVLNTKDSKNLDSKSGGLLGFSWYNTDVEFKSVTIGDTVGCTVSMNNESKHGNFAGLVYAGTGNWKVTDLDIKDITVNSSASAVSFGMILNTGWNNLIGSGNPNGTASAVYLLLPTTGCYDIDTASFGETFDADVYDELVAYSSYYRVGGDSTNDGNARYGYVKGDAEDLYVLRNRQGVVSIHTDVTNGLTMDGSTASNSYIEQTSKGGVANPYTRYYYNLDSVTNRDSTKLTSAQMKMMSWGLNLYAHRSISSNFASVAFDDLDYNMTGYSWYPVDVDSGTNVTIKGTFTFANEEFEGSEALNRAAQENGDSSGEDGSGTDDGESTGDEGSDTGDGETTSNEGSGTDDAESSFARTSLDTPEKTQHYLLHAGVFRNVTGTVNIGAANGTVTFKGNVSTAKDGSGALICGTVRGSNANNHAYIYTPGSISLAGIRIAGFAADADYAPLLINKMDSNSDIDISDVSTASNAYQNGVRVATSLLGNAGNDKTDSIKIEFSRMKLDARDTVTLADLTDIYKTDNAIFTKATLLNQFSYRSGGTGIYNYERSQDWNGTSHVGKVTYGLELWDGSVGTDGKPDNHISGKSQYIGQEHRYLNETTYYTSPESNNKSDGPYNFAGFLPYVNKGYDKSAKQYQLSVNHSSASLTGCGTYNDPYYISDSENAAKAGNQLKTIEQILNSNNLSNQKINLPLNSNDQVDFSLTWDTNSHAEFQYHGKNEADGYPEAAFYRDGQPAQKSDAKNYA
ncbi:MAG: hypothetical protein IJ242_06140, partial [Clostridia bacterium]|nr:hypothetical protein [Clostridia bacterium]